MKETQDVITAIQALTNTIRKAQADGVIDWKDGRYLLPFLAEMKDAVQGFQDIPGEIKNANGEELERAYQETLDAILEFLAVVAS